MTLTKGFLAVAGAMIAGAAIGAALGWFVGTRMPELYREWSGRGDAPDFSPVEYGASLGLLQGAGAGVVVGVALVALVTWYEVSTARRDRD